MIAGKISTTLGITLSGLSGVIGDVERADIQHRVDELSDKIPEISVEELLQEDKDNFMILYTEINSIEMKKGGILSPTSFRFIISKKKFSFNLINRKEFPKHVEMIKTILPDKN